MNYRKLNRAMEESGVNYDVQETKTSIHIKTDPDKNEIAQQNIAPALAKYETCVNSSPGNFSVIQTDIKVYKMKVEPKLDLES